MNKEQQELLDEAYKNYLKQFEIDENNFNGEEVAKGHNDQCWGYPLLENTSKEYKRGQINAYLEGKADKPFFYLKQEEFINKIKNDDEFSENWGLKIDERELSLEERTWYYETTLGRLHFIPPTIDTIDKENIPTKLITITYNDKTIESYE